VVLVVGEEGPLKRNALNAFVNFISGTKS